MVFECHDISAEPWAAAFTGEEVVEKSTWNGFHQTPLESILRNKGITAVAGFGLITSRCVHQTMFGAFNLGYRTIVIEDCCGDRSRERHDAELMLNGGSMYEVITSDQFIEAISDT